ncbi:hypothetical protein [Candidatus Nephthysia bennettiae]|uniref:Helix-turn-helix domain-containing protein n=1 Tax=Candidatus Nephthysia bennettiae TaxID=3127016 RepID=A0A934K814_9BACT|nr:helix-turn-helix domain-containing protein [Candidatus Dormibacteraeota bacterium]
MAGLADAKRDRKGPLKATLEVVAFVRTTKQEQPGLSGADLGVMLKERFGIQLHRRTVERLLHIKNGSWRRRLQADWEPAYEEMRATALAGKASPDAAMAARFAQFGAAGLARQPACWEVIVSQAPEPRWTGSDPRRATLQSAYRITLGGSQ